MNIIKLPNGYVAAAKFGTVEITNPDIIIKIFALGDPAKDFIQLVKLEPIASYEQLIFALEQTFDAFARGTNFSQKKELEFLLRLAGVRHINKALELFALKCGEQEIAVVVATKDETKLNKIFREMQKLIPFKEVKNAIKKNLIKNKQKIMEIYSISDAELTALKDKENPIGEAVLERIAMVTLQN